MFSTDSQSDNVTCIIWAREHHVASFYAVPRIIESGIIMYLTLFIAIQNDSCQEDIAEFS